MAHILLDFDAYKHNLEYLGSKLGDISKLMVVLKDNAYGHGIKKIAPLAAACGIKRAVVKNISEAKKIMDFFDKVLILIESSPSKALVHEKLIYACDSLEALELFPPQCYIDLKLDTNMHRHGILKEQIQQAFEIIVKRRLNLVGAFTHFYSADMLRSDFFVQKKIFDETKITCKHLTQKYNLPPLCFHSRNSSAILRIQDDFDDDFARAGIASYGYCDLPSEFGTFDLKPVLSLWAKKICTKHLKKGDVVGYGASFIANEDMTISSYDVGYGDGLFRQNGINNTSTKQGLEFLGKMSMDCFSVKSTEEYICVFDDVSKMAKHFNTISYEILTKLSPYLKKIVTYQTKS